MRSRIVSLLVTALVGTISCSRADDPTVPAPRAQDYPWMSLETWHSMHREDVEIAKRGGVDVLFVGDSITQGWADSPRWKEDFVPLRAANFGIGGDRTENVLWRLEHGAVGVLQPKVVVLLIGTNNFGFATNTPDDVARGVGAVVAKLREAFPATKILLLGIFPRDASAAAPIRAQIANVNRTIAKLGDERAVFFRDIGAIFLEPDGSISPEVMRDFLHLTPEGYRRWADAILPPIRAWLAE